MHSIRTWAHKAAHEHRFNPWSVIAHHNESRSTTDNAREVEITESEQDKPVSRTPLSRRFWSHLKRTIFHSWINVLLVFVPAGLATHFGGINPNVVFGLNCVAIIPLAGLLTLATESVAHKLGPTWGALLNVSFGNAVELIIFIIALTKDEIRVVQASLVGSILANLLLILGMAFLIGGLEYQEQVYDATVTQMSACFLALSVLSLLLPTAFHASFNDLDLADAAVLKVSRGSSVILLLMYVLYLLFQLKSHAYLYQGTPQHIINQNLEPGILSRYDAATTSISNSRRSSLSITSPHASGTDSPVRRRIRSKLGIRRSVKTEVIDEQNRDGYNSSEKVVQVAGNDSDIIFSPRTTESTTLASPDTVSTLSSVTQIIATESQKNHGDNGKTSTATIDSIPSTGTPVRPSLRTTLTIRPPPVFRTSTTPGRPMHMTRTLSQHHLRRMRSEPMMQAQTDVSRTQASAQTSPGTTEQSQSKGEPPMSQTASIILLCCSTALIALCAEALVGSIEHLVESSSISEAFIGLIILPIVGNAAEHVTAVTVAAKNKLDLSLGVSLGSSIQIAIFVTPIVVILGWALDKSMSLYFNLFETASLFVSAFIVNFLVLDGRSNYLEGALLCACYIIIALAAFFFPDNQNQSAISRGGGGSQ